MDDILQLLLDGGSPQQRQQAMAEKIRAQQALQAGLQTGQQQGSKMDLLNFAAQNSNNPALAAGVGTLQKSQAARYKPTPLGNTAVMVGDQVLDNPAYTETKDADRQSRLMQAAAIYQAKKAATEAKIDSDTEKETGRNERAAEGRALRMTLAGIMGAGRADRSAEKAERDAEKAAAGKSKQLDQYSAKYSGALQTAGVPEFSSALEIAEGTLNNYPKGKLPGFGRVLSAVPNALLDNESQGVRADMQQAANILLKTRSGTAVTDNEMKRFLQEVATGAGMSEDALRRGWSNVRKSFDTKAQSIAAGFSPEVHNAYLERGGKEYRKAGAAPKPDPIDDILKLYPPKK